MPHEDGAAYAPVVATISLGAPIVLEIYAKGAEGEQGEMVGRILQEPGSLLVTTGEAYTGLMHGIAGVERDEGLGLETIANWELLGNSTREAVERGGGVNERGTRISLTYRDVLKVSKIGLGLVKR